MSNRKKPKNQDMQRLTDLLNSFEEVINGDEPKLLVPPALNEWLRRRFEADPPPNYNAWKCEACGKLTVCVDIHSGVTPMYIACRRTVECRGMAISAGYPTDPIPERVMKNLAWEWYRPSATEFATLSAEATEHVMNGGLMLRPHAPQD